MTALQAACFPIAIALVQQAFNPPAPLPETAKDRKNRLARERRAEKKHVKYSKEIVL